MAVNPACLQALRVLIAFLDERHVLHVIVGGAALQLIYGVASVRATADVDTVILVDSWEEYNTLVEALKAREWKLDPEHEYRLRAEGCIMDLLPYPVREIRDDRLVLPRSRGVLSTVGWIEALTQGQVLR